MDTPISKEVLYHNQKTTELGFLLTHDFLGLFRNIQGYLKNSFGAPPFLFQVLLAFKESYFEAMLLLYTISLNVNKY